jgi:imidazolonepropionase-like amidohydrolase
MTRWPNLAARLLSAWFVLAGICAVAWGAEDTFVIKGAKIFTSGKQGILTDAVLLIENGRFGKVIQNETGLSVPVKDYSGKTIMPGIVDAHSFVSAYYRLLENTDVITSDLVAGIVFDPSGPEAKHALESGITTVNLVPRSENLVGGISSILKLDRESRSLSFMKEQAFLKISFNGEAIRSDREPTSLMGAEHLLSRKLESMGMESGRNREGIFPQKGLRSLLKGDLLPIIAASDMAEINTALRFLEKWRMHGILVGGEEACHLSLVLKEKGIPVLMSPILSAYPDRLVVNAARLVREGVIAAFVSHMPEADPLSLRISAMMLCHHGISQEEALKTITCNPARILGISDSVGSIEEGKDADFIVMEGDPLDLGSPIVAVYVNGKAVFTKGN